ncbi:MAG: DUF951 domain-containing protein [Clostridia bacterium]|nr:DUF951 domain-containing protein [Clostridia bacterium]MBQ2249269.1 DUF951 domain-containing protein [Clostridia bacterium]MBQ5772453.1 DUF951 domain-containing protein [Clostridia bacterium]MBQ5893180.1 DUF951 domain-containing protein [Clostridia bacterium]
MQIVPLYADSRLQLKKPHPCGSDVFRVLRVGSDVRIRCEGCGRDMTLDRLRLERSVKKILSTTSDAPDRKGTTPS